MLSKYEADLPARLFLKISEDVRDAEMKKKKNKNEMTRRVAAFSQRDFLFNYIAYVFPDRREKKMSRIFLDAKIFGSCNSSIHSGHLWLLYVPIIL